MCSWSQDEQNGNTLQLRPSQIRYSQDSISNTFDVKCLHSDTQIGETLDQLCDRRCSIYDIPRIKVCRLSGNDYITADNRRLWVFRQLEKLGGCTKVPVTLINYIPAGKLTTENGGQEVRVRGPPGGVWHRKCDTTARFFRPIVLKEAQHVVIPRAVSRNNSTYESGDRGIFNGRTTSPRATPTTRSYENSSRSYETSSTYHSSSNWPAYDRRTYPNDKMHTASPYMSYNKNRRNVDNMFECPCTIL